MRLLVTGCNGYVGGHLIETLLARGHEVVGVDHRAESWQEFGKAGAYRFAWMELAEWQAAEPLARELEGVEAVFHLASHQPFSWEPAPFVRGNVGRTATLLEAMRMTGTPRLVHSSTFAVYGDPERVPIAEGDPVNPKNIYEVTKYQAEMLARVYAETGAFKACVLRYTSLYGGRNRVGSLHYFVESVLHGAPIRLFAGGRTLKDYVHVADVVEANVACLGFEQSGPFEVFNVGGGDAVSTSGLVGLVSRLAGKAAEITFAEDEHWRAADSYLDVSKARRLLGYEPRSMEAGVGLYLSELRAAEGAAA